MPVALIVIAVLAVWAPVLAPRLLSVFGLIVHCAMFWFPLGLTGLVAAGVLLVFLLRPPHSLEQAGE